MLARYLLLSCVRPSVQRTPSPGNRQLPPEIFCRPQFLERIIPYTLLLEYKKQPFVLEYPDILGRQISKKIVDTAAAWSVITDAVAAAVPVVITD